MRIAAWSDGHGELPMLAEHVDVLIIAGDISPLSIQTREPYMLEWFMYNFLDYAKAVDADRVLFVPGNHDFLFESMPPKKFNEYIEDDEVLKTKLVYLVDTEYNYNGVKFYGCPWCTGPIGWPFSPKYKNDSIYVYYDQIPEDCDVLITHQPPQVETVGCSYPGTSREQDFGSSYLRDTLDELNIKYHFCGHIHTGTHYGVDYKNTKIYNVSLLNESYNDAYDVTYINI